MKPDSVFGFAIDAFYGLQQIGDIVQIDGNLTTRVRLDCSRWRSAASSAHAGSPAIPLLRSPAWRA